MANMYKSKACCSSDVLSVLVYQVDVTQKNDAHATAAIPFTYTLIKTTICQTHHYLGHRYALKTLHTFSRVEKIRIILKPRNRRITVNVVEPSPESRMLVMI